MKTVRASIRQLFYSLFRAVSDFEGFVCDYFKEEYDQMGQIKVSYDAKITELVSRRSEEDILDALYSHIEKNRKSYTADYYSYIKDCVEQLMNGEPLDHLREIRGKEIRGETAKSRATDKPRYAKLKKLATWAGLLYLWEKLSTIWKQLGLTIRTDGNGKLIIVSTAGGCLVISTGIWSCYYRDKPLFDHNSSPRLESTAPINFCLRDLSVHLLPSTDLEMDKNILSANMINLIVQTYFSQYYAASYRQNYSAHYQSQLPLMTQSPYLGQWQYQPPMGPFVDCALSSVGRVQLDLKLTIYSRIEKTIKICYRDGKCFDSFVRSESCDFSFSVQDPLHEYECPVSEFSLSSPGMSYIEMNIQPLQMDSRQRASLALENCKGSISAISLLSSCRRNPNHSAHP